MRAGLASAAVRRPAGARRVASSALSAARNLPRNTARARARETGSPGARIHCPSACERPAGHQAVQVQVLRSTGSRCAAAGWRRSRRRASGGCGRTRAGSWTPRRTAAVDRPRVALGQRVELVGQGEHHVEVGHGQQFGAPGGEPALLGERLALGTVAVAAGVIAYWRSPQVSHWAMWPPSSAVRQRAMARSARCCTALKRRCARSSRRGAHDVRQRRLGIPLPHPPPADACARPRPSARGVGMLQQFQRRGRGGQVLAAPSGSSAAWS